MDTSAGEGARFQFASDQSLLVTFGQEITLQAHQQVVKLLRLLDLEPVLGIRNLHPAYCSLLVKFDGLRLRHEEVEAILRRCLERLDEVILPEPHQVEISSKPLYSEYNFPCHRASAACALGHMWSPANTHWRRSIYAALHQQCPKGNG